MSRAFAHAILMFAPIASCQIQEAEGYCSRCVKIESERAQQNAEHPEPLRYYEDNIEEGGASQAKTPILQQSSQPQESSAVNRENSPQSTQKDHLKTATPMSKGHAIASTKIENEIRDNNSLSLQAGSSIFAQQSNPKRFPFSSEDGSYPSNESQYFFEEEEVWKKPVPAPPVPKPLKNVHSTLLTLFKTKAFLETLDGSFTLLLPTDEAFNKLPSGTLVELIKPENSERLARLASNHLIARKLLRTDFKRYKNREIKAISGKNLTLYYEDGQLWVDDARVISIIPAGYDGVILVIDEVLDH